MSRKHSKTLPLSRRVGDQGIVDMDTSHLLFPTQMALQGDEGIEDIMDISMLNNMDSSMLNAHRLSKSKSHLSDQSESDMFSDSPQSRYSTQSQSRLMSSDSSDPPRRLCGTPASKRLFGPAKSTRLCGEDLDRRLCAQASRKGSDTDKMWF